MIRLLASISGEDSAFSEEDVLATLAHRQQLVHQATFTGRPATQLYATEAHVVKLRTDFVFRERDVERKAQAARKADVELGVYHPLKTWFILEENDELQIGNITPRLKPLHKLIPSRIKSKPDVSLAMLGDIVRLYCVTAKNKERRLDEGLSNFGADEKDRVYYLDDDSYCWDNFTSLASMLAVWIRQLEELTTPLAIKFAHSLANILYKVFGSTHANQVLYGQLRNNMAVSTREKKCIDAIMHVLANVTQDIYQQKSKGAVSAARLADKVNDLSKNQLRQLSVKRFGVIADVHANLPALEKVLQELKDKKVEQILVLGDTVGYGPQPNECVNLLCSVPCLVIQGNHDFATATGDTSKGFSRLAAWAIEWTRTRIKEEQRNWLGGLPPVWEQDNWMAVHGAPIDKNYFFGYVYHMTYQANLDWLEQKKMKIAFHGHSHIQLCYSRALGSDDKLLAKQINLTGFDNVLICPGSVGQPRGGSAEAEYGIYDSGEHRMELYKTAYDISSVVSIMKKENFPSQLYERLVRGA